jgi:hypothetical protein
MASFGLDIGHGRSICVEATGKGVDLNTYTALPSGQLVKVSAKSLTLNLKAWKKFVDNLEDIKTTFYNLSEDTGVKTDFFLHLGQNIYIRAVSEISCIHIRKYYFNKDECVIKPGRPGIAFKYLEFKELLKNLTSINEITSITTVSSCCTAATQKDCITCIEKTVN